MRICYEKAGFTLSGVTENAFRYREESWGRCSMTAGGTKKEKPAYLYHGSQYLFDIVKPRQAAGSCVQEARMAVYAAETVREVIPFALPIRWYPDGPEGKRNFTCREGRTELLYGSLDPEGAGYVYKVPSEGFEKIDSWQWVSEQEVVPEEIIKINVRDYWDTVTFSEEAARINTLLYGSLSEKTVMISG